MSVCVCVFVSACLMSLQGFTVEEPKGSKALAKRSVTCCSCIVMFELAGLSHTA